MHGAQAKSGPDAPNWQGGKSYVPPRIKDDYERILASDQLLSLREEIAKQKAYYLDLERRTEDGAVVAKATIAVVLRMLDAYERFIAARRQRSQGILQQALVSLDATVAAVRETMTQAVRETESRKELRETWLVLERLTKAEVSKFETLYNMLDPEAARALRDAEHAAFVDALEQYVPDPAIKVLIHRAVAARLAQLAPRPNHPVLDAAGGARATDAIDTEAIE